MTVLSNYLVRLSSPVVYKGKNFLHISELEHGWSANVDINTFMWKSGSLVLTPRPACVHVCDFQNNVLVGLVDLGIRDFGILNTSVHRCVCPFDSTTLDRGHFSGTNLTNALLFFLLSTTRVNSCIICGQQNTSNSIHKYPPHLRAFERHLIRRGFAKQGFSKQADDHSDWIVCKYSTCGLSLRISPFLRNVMMSISGVHF